MATLSIKQLKERAKGLWRLSQPKDCCAGRGGCPVRVEVTYDITRDETFGTCTNCGREVFRLTSAQIVEQTPEAARSQQERSRVRRSQPVVQAEQRKLGVTAVERFESRARQLAEQEEAKPKKPDKPDTAIDTNRFANLEDD